MARWLRVEPTRARARRADPGRRRRLEGRHPPARRRGRGRAAPPSSCAPPTPTSWPGWPPVSWCCGRGTVGAELGRRRHRDEPHRAGAAAATSDRRGAGRARRRPAEEASMTTTDHREPGGTRLRPAGLAAVSALYLLGLHHRALRAVDPRDVPHPDDVQAGARRPGGHRHPRPRPARPARRRARSTCRSARCSPSRWSSSAGSRPTPGHARGRRLPDRHRGLRRGRASSPG